MSKYTYFNKEETERLVNLAKDGEQNAIELLFKKFKAILYSNIKKSHIDLSHEEYEDEVLIFLTRILTRDIEKYDNKKASFGTWITKCFNNHILSISNRKKKVTTDSINDMYESGLYEIEDDSFSIERMNVIPFVTIIRMLYKHLNPIEVRLIVEKYWYGSNSKDAEIKAGVPHGTCSQKIKRALKKLNKHINKEDYL